MNTKSTNSIKIISFLLLFYSIFAHSQGVFAPLNPEYYYLLDRYEVKSGKYIQDIHSSYKPYLRKNIASFADTLSQDSTLSKVDKFNLNYFKAFLHQTKFILPIQKQRISISAEPSHLC
jgi:hypothetical protein